MPELLSYEFAMCILNPSYHSICSALQPQIYFLFETKDDTNAEKGSGS